MKKIIYFSLGYFVLLYLMYYLALPAMNFKSVGFYFYLMFIIGYILMVLGLIFKNKIIQKAMKSRKTFKQYKHVGNGVYRTSIVNASDKFSTSFILINCVGIAFLFIITLLTIFGLSGSKMFRSNAYYKQLEIKNGSEQEFSTAFDYNNGSVMLPVIDKDLAFREAEQHLGDYGAQYRIDYQNFTIITVNRNGVDELVRVAPLEYDNLFVSLSRKNQGTIGYIEVNVVTSEAKLVEVNGGLQYMQTAKFGKDLDRHIRFNYPATLYSDKYFEIDDTGKPYWVIPTYTNKIGLLSGKTPTGVILCDPTTGKTDKYKIGDEPKWVDRVIVDSIVADQATNAFKFKNGYINATIGQKKEVFQVSDGYNYFIKNGQTYYISCITSPNEADQTSIGFVTINLKTKEAVRYSKVGITEMRARSIAMQDERVKAQDLDATWPILINYRGVPTYFLVLKNEVKAQKMVYVNVVNGSLVAMGNSFEEAEEAYDSLIANSGIITIKNENISGEVTRIRDLGTTIEFMLSTENNKYFTVNTSLNNVARFLNIGDEVNIEYKEYTSYNFVVNISYK